MRTRISLKFFAAGFAVLTPMILAHSQPLMINTFAGHDVTGSADGISSSARFNHPNNIAADSAGNIFVADTENSVIRKISPNGVVSTFAGIAGNSGSANGIGTNAQFYGPQGIAVDSADNLYVADTANATIRKITPDGIVSTLAGSSGNVNSFDGVGTNAQFYQPQALTVDNAGNVFVADTWNHTIRKITAAGAVSTFAGLAGHPGSADGTNSQARFNWPSGIAVDNSNNLFVTDFLNHTIRQISPDGLVSTIAGWAGIWGDADGTNQSARFFQPQGILADNAGDLFVTDSGNQTIRKIAISGTNHVVTTIAGRSGIAGNADGTGSSARFSFPAGLAQDGDGFFYIADLGNNTIRTERIVPPTLRYSANANQLVFSWPVSASGFVFESANNSSPGTLWTAQTNGVVISGDEFIVTTNRENTAAFYRLRR